MWTEQSLLYYFQKFDPSRLTFARELRGLTKKALADLISRTSSAITQLESGTLSPSFELFSKVIEKLQIHPSLLSSEATPLPYAGMDGCHFRANKRVPQIERQAARCYAVQVLAIYSYLENLGVLFPEQKFRCYEGAPRIEQEMEAYASEIRQDLGLGMGPIHNMAELLESIGVRIVLLPTEAARLDAFAAWIDDRPCVMIAENSPASRMQFDYGHEFSHLLQDGDTIPGDLMAERRANRFSSAFLMPAETFAQNCPPCYRSATFLELKSFWHVSIAAALFRARQLGVMTERSYTNAIISRSKTGEHKKESGEFAKPLPTLLPKALGLVGGSLTLPMLAEGVGIHEKELEDILLCQKVPQALVDAMKPAPRKASVLKFSQRKPNEANS